ncbi:unnamed protein product [Boreogadus saida]
MSGLKGVRPRDECLLDIIVEINANMVAALLECMQTFQPPAPSYPPNHSQTQYPDGYAAYGFPGPPSPLYLQL